MLKKILSLVFGFWLLVSLVYAQEQITITTYYPSPFGSYRELETETLFFRETTDGLISFRYPDTTYDRRLRITAGLSDTADNDQGASIDLHGNNHANAGRLDLVAGRAGDITFWTSPAATSALERMRITNTGNVGIGTGTTAARLHVMGDWDGGISALRLGGAKPTIRFTPDNTASEGTREWIIHRGSAPANSLQFYYDDGAGGWTHAVTMQDNGNVGIGTTGPSSALHISQGDADIRLDTGTGEIPLIIRADNDVPAGWTNPLIRTGGGGSLQIDSSDASGVYGKLYLNANRNSDVILVTATGGGLAGGNVGIGTVTPAYLLDVAGDINTTGDVRKNGAAYSNPDYVFEPGYALLPLGELKKFVAEKKHLPNMPSTQEIKKEGVKVFEQNRLMLEKLEEAYLYIIKLEERIAKLEAK